MTLEDAVAHAQRCKDEGLCSTSAKALVTLLNELEEFNKIHPDTKALIFKRMSKRSGKLPRNVESALRGHVQIYQD